MLTKTGTLLALPALLLGSALGVSALAQSGSSQGQTTQTPDSSTPSSANTPTTTSPDDKGSYATGKPLQGDSKEGFWGHLNPLARKKWVNRQVSPIKGQVNELDQLQSKNASDIHDVDSRSQAGIKSAMSAASTADQHAQDAATRANSANTLAGSASTRTDALGHTVGNLDQYQTVSQSAIPFAAGKTALGPKAKGDLDTFASSLASEKGYIIEIQGYSRGGVQSSQAMADSVARYLVTEHQVPVYRIYRTGLGRDKTAPQAGDQAQTADQTIVNGVRVTLLHNSLATMGSNSASNSTTPGSGSPQQANQ